MIALRTLRIAATRVLAEAGWDAEAIAIALAISRSGVERTLAPPLPAPRPVAKPRLADPPTGACCQLVGSRVCDAPTPQGAAFCIQHSHGVWST